jgi:predicted nucleotide-binding protein
MNGQDLVLIADRLDALSGTFLAEHEGAIQRVLASSKEIAKSWSGSNLGYHADIYYENLEPRPPGAQFSSEWGLDNAMGMGTRGRWQEFDRAEVRSKVLSRAGNPDLIPAEVSSKDVAKVFQGARAQVLSSLTLEAGDDNYLKALLAKAEACEIRDVSDLVRAQVPTGQTMSRDTMALTQGRRAAVHQSVIAEMWALEQPALCAKELSEIARQAGSHLIRKEARTRRSNLVGTNVFIGHGRAPAWRELKDFIKDRLQLPYDEFNRVPVAGITNISRLNEMLDAAAVAFLVLTAEDELADGKQQARMNVVHEVGLFQGRLGFTKAIILLEDGCEEFSNVEGLGQIRFPAGNVAAAFEEVRLVLEREGMLSSN